MGYFYDAGSLAGVLGMIVVVATMTAWTIHITMNWIAYAYPLFDILNDSEMNLSTPLETMRQLSKRAVIPISSGPSSVTGSQISLLVRLCFFQQLG